MPQILGGGAPLQIARCVVSLITVLVVAHVVRGRRRGVEGFAHETVEKK